MHSSIIGKANIPKLIYWATSVGGMASPTQGRQGRNGGPRRLRAPLGQGFTPARRGSPHCRSETVRSFARSAGRLAKNDKIDAAMIAWFAETFDQAPSQAYDAAREELVQMVNARQGLLDLQTTLQNRDEHSEVSAVQKMHARLLKRVAGEVLTLEAAIPP